MILECLFVDFLSPLSLFLWQLPLRRTSSSLSHYVRQCSFSLSPCSRFLSEMSPCTDPNWLQSCPFLKEKSDWAARRTFSHKDRHESFWWPLCVSVCSKRHKPPTNQLSHTLLMKCIRWYVCRRFHTNSHTYSLILLLKSVLLILFFYLLFLHLV